MIPLGWMLSRRSRTLYSYVGEDYETPLPPPEVSNTLEMVNKDELLQHVTSSLIDEIIVNVVRDVEDREEIVTHTVANLVDIFLDMKGDQGEYSREDEILVNEVVEELIDGVTEMISEEPMERIMIETSSETAELSESIALCELVLLAMNRLLLVSELSRSEE